MSTQMGQSCPDCVKTKKWTCQLRFKPKNISSNPIGFVDVDFTDYGAFKSYLGANFLDTLGEFKI